MEGEGAAVSEQEGAGEGVVDGGDAAVDDDHFASEAQEDGRGGDGVADADAARGHPQENCTVRRVRMKPPATLP